VEPNDILKEEILSYCRDRIAKYALPREIEFRSELPKTLVGKVAYRKLEEEANGV
jgi:long-chain acyl-CoA synthetase